MDLDTWPPRTNNLDQTMGYILLTFFWPLGKREWGLRLQRMMDRVLHADCWDYYMPVHDYEAYGARFMSSDRSKFEEELANMKHIEKTEVIPFTDIRVIDFTNVTSARDVDEDGAELMTPTADVPDLNEDRDKKPAAKACSPKIEEGKENQNIDSRKDGSRLLYTASDGRSVEEDPVAEILVGEDSELQELKPSGVNVSNVDFTGLNDIGVAPANDSPQLSSKGEGVVDLTSPSNNSNDCKYKFTSDMDFQWHCRRRLRGLIFIMTMIGPEAHRLRPTFYLTKYDKGTPLMYSKEDYKMLVDHFMIKAGLNGGCEGDIIRNKKRWYKGWTEDDYQAVCDNLKALEKKVGCWDNMNNEERTYVYDRHLGVLRKHVTHEEERLWLALYEHDKYQDKLCQNGSVPHPDDPEGGCVGTMDALWSTTLRHQLDSAKKHWMWNTDEGKEWKKEEERKHRNRLGMKTPPPPNVPFPCNPLTPGGQHEIRPWHPLQTPPPSGPQYTPKSCCSSLTDNFPGIYDKKTSVSGSAGGDYESDEDDGSLRDFIVNSEEEEDEDECENNDGEDGGQTKVKGASGRHVNKKICIPAKVTKSTKTRKKKKMKSPDIESDDEVSDDEEDVQPFLKKKGLAGLKNILFEDSE